MEADDGIAHRVISFRGVRLALQRSETPALLFEDVGKAGNVDIGLLEPSQRTITPAAMLRDTCGFFDDGAVLIGTSVEDVPDLALAHEDVLVAADTTVGQQLVEVEESARRAVEQVLRCPVAIEPAGHRDLVEIERQETVGVVERERHLGATEPRAGRSAGEDDIVHLLGAQRRGRLSAHHPRERVEQVGLPRAVRPDHDVHPGVELEAGAVGERLEAGERQSLQQQGARRLPVNTTHVIQLRAEGANRAHRDARVPTCDRRAGCQMSDVRCESSELTVDS